MAASFSPAQQVVSCSYESENSYLIATRRYRRALCLCVFFVLIPCFIYTHSKASAPLDFSKHLLSLQHLREAGETLARRYPGAPVGGSEFKEVGCSVYKRPLSKAAAKFLVRHVQAIFMPIDWERVRESCKAPRFPRSQAQREPRVVLVTGAAGFIGMHTAMAIRKRGDGVLGIDNFNDYYPVSLKRARQLNAQAVGVYTVDGDLNDMDLLRQLFHACPFTHVIHMAAQAGVRHATVSPKNAMSYVHSNLEAQVALFEVVKEQVPPPIVIYASSSSVYGLSKKQPFSEDDRVDSPTSLYAATKRADELIAHSYHQVYGISMTGLRFFTVYGPWGRPDMAAYKFAVSLIKDDAISIFQGPNSSELSRDFTYIDDIVTGVLAAMDTTQNDVNGEAEYRIFNLGNTHPHTISELVSLLEICLDRHAHKKYIPLPPSGEMLATYADITRAQQELLYQPRISLEEGLRRFSAWFEEYYGLDVVSRIPSDWHYKPV